MSETTDTEIVRECVLSVNYNKTSLLVAVNESKAESPYLLLFDFTKLDDKVKPICNWSLQRPIRMIERKSISKLLAVSYIDEPKSLKITSFHKLLFSLNYPGKVRRIRMTPDRLVVSQNYQIVIQNLTNMEAMHTILSFHSNPKGLFALSYRLNFLAYPTNEPNIGWVNVYDAYNFRHIKTFQAHKNELVAIEFSSCGTKIATASVNGTLCKVFSTIEGRRLFNCRIGTDSIAIESLWFSSCTDYLICCSENNEIKIFNIIEINHNKSDESWSQYLLKKTASLLNSNTDYFKEIEPFAYLPKPSDELEVKRVCDIRNTGMFLTLYVVSSNGYLNTYRINKSNYNAECQFMQQTDLLTRSELVMTDMDDDLVDISVV